MEPISLHYEYTRADHAELFRAVAQRAWKKRGQRILVLVTLIIIVLALLSWLRASTALIAFFSGVIIGILLMAWRWFRVVRRNYHLLWDKNPGFQAAMRTTISETSLRRESLNGISEWNWPAFSSYFETAAQLVLKVGSYTVPLPKRAFVAPDDLLRLRELLQSKMIKPGSPS